MTIATADGMLEPVQFEIARTKLEASFTLAAQQSAAAGAELVQAEGLQHEIVCPVVETADTGFDLLTCGKHKDGKVCVNGTYLFEDLFAILDGHVEVEDGQVRQLLPESFNRHGSVPSQPDAMAVRLETSDEKHAKSSVVFCDE
jgi:hypothetical protein